MISPLLDRFGIIAFPTANIQNHPSPHKKKGYPKNRFFTILPFFKAWYKNQLIFGAMFCHDDRVC